MSVRGKGFSIYSRFPIPSTSTLLLRKTPILSPLCLTLSHHSICNFKAILKIFCRSTFLSIVHLKLVQIWHFKLFSIFGNFFLNLPPYFGHFTATFLSLSASCSQIISLVNYLKSQMVSACIAVYWIMLILGPLCLVSWTSPMKDSTSTWQMTRLSNRVRPTMTPYSYAMQNNT